MKKTDRITSIGQWEALLARYGYDGPPGPRLNPFQRSDFQRRMNKRSLKVQARKRKLRERERVKRMRAARKHTGRHFNNAEKLKAPLPGAQMLVARMEPQRWYRRPELTELMPEYPRNSLKAFLAQKMPREGLIEKAFDPDPVDPSRGHMPAKNIFVYRLTKKAEQLRPALIEYLAMVD